MNKLAIGTLVTTDWHEETEDAVLLKVGKAPRNCPQYLLDAEERGEKYWLLFNEPMDDYGDGTLIADLPSGWYDKERIICVDDMLAGFGNLLATYGVD
jgi:hypothetical protein